MVFEKYFIPGIILAAAVVIAVYLVAVFNRFLNLKNSAEANLGQIEIAMKKRLEGG